MDELTKTQRLYVQIFHTYLQPAIEALGENPNPVQVLLAVADAQAKTDETLDFCEHDKEVATAFIRDSLRSGAPHQ